ncbi:Uncharacterized protein OS=Planctomyces limnophilus (strain ATCC 43296 / DSM 3776 / IFAM 1008 / 290) GN=Plim_3766 PE=4 SV=1: DoxX [Gemmata massiliana]|uniref:DoxX family protein n=1 Tax=Gemmata massiliana TaxID=1210884 RepID=A0A6P2D2P1_9BACT|nr:DoxX family protein [Gemmata massiliana]VTR95409.1 Uncharacterized protein OS=Planctomyces limnophilus (strain ATCC 43296 / DSM 3776 / IFAM 1008 / 290) GN=Plim_3766 PE=4 SV=1: DoxX [Gemmata massiliana]
MSHLPIPLSVLYAGLAGTLIALVVATATNKWSLRVFFLLALRIAIGWHFTFEGLHKIHSIHTGVTDTNRPFSSEPYFKVAPGPLGAQMRKQFSDPEAEIAKKVRVSESISRAEFLRLSPEEQAKKCPEEVRNQFDALESNAKQLAKSEAERELKDATTAEEKAVKGATEAEGKATKAAKTDAERTAAKTAGDAARAKAKAEGDKAREAAQKKLESHEKTGDELVLAVKAAYARWVYGADARPAQVKFISGDLQLTAPQRLDHLEWVRKEARDAEERQSLGLGNGTGTDSKRVAEFRMGAITAEADLARDANAFIDELKKDLGFKPDPNATPELSVGQRMDRFTMWFLVVVGSCLMAGLLTRLACVMAAGFLVMTYLAHPAFPWYPLPPNTEGNPLFINKNVIEALALLALACYPTGRWLGLDAIVLRPFCKCNGCPA